MSDVPAQSVDFSRLHTFGLGGVARGLDFIRSLADLARYRKAYLDGQSLWLLGEGSNTVFLNPLSSRHLWVMALKGRQFLGTWAGRHHLRVMAGENWHALVEWTVAMNWPGLENLALIPGSVGASPVQNIGAYGVELKDRVSAVHVYDLQNGEHGTLTLDECQFEYRDSVFKQQAAGRYVITAVDFALPVKWQPVLGYGDVTSQVQAFGEVSPLNVLKAICAVRTAKLPDPAVLGNAGSFFKNPVVCAAELNRLLSDHPNIVHYPAPNGQFKLAAGWMIEQAGLKGSREGGVGVYEKQALILVNHGHGSGSDLQALIKRIQETIQSRFGIHLEAEPNLIVD
ncbi:MAG: UDP-N-acetylmuramate dehydrogenase [Limnobacter sp.]|uniref:UDP-N-acetylmuramate dehydrogenase n=1 Tax=Limnobacter sp. TaxID=2003368 RepID=UPI0039196B30